MNSIKNILLPQHLSQLILLLQLFVPSIQGFFHHHYSILSLPSLSLSPLLSSSYYPSNNYNENGKQQSRSLLGMALFNKHYNHHPTSFFNDDKRIRGTIWHQQEKIEKIKNQNQLKRFTKKDTVIIKRKRQEEAPPRQRFDEKIYFPHENDNSNNKETGSRRRILRLRQSLKNNIIKNDFSINASAIVKDFFYGATLPFRNALCFKIILLEVFLFSGTPRIMNVFSNMKIHHHYPSWIVSSSTAATAIYNNKENGMLMRTLISKLSKGMKTKLNCIIVLITTQMTLLFQMLCLPIIFVVSSAIGFILFQQNPKMTIQKLFLFMSEHSNLIRSIDTCIIGPLMEEIEFRFFLPVVLQCFVRRIIQMVHNYNDITMIRSNSKQQDRQPVKAEIVALLPRKEENNYYNLKENKEDTIMMAYNDDSSHRIVKIVCSALFAICHLRHFQNNYDTPPTSFDILETLVGTFATAQFLFLPAYERNGLFAAWGAHASWNTIVTRISSMI